MRLSGQAECGDVIKTIDVKLLTPSERLQLAQVYALLGIAESLESLSSAVWSRRSSRMGEVTEEGGE